MELNFSQSASPTSSSKPFSCTLFWLAPHCNLPVLPQCHNDCNNHNNHGTWSSKMGISSATCPPPTIACGRIKELLIITRLAPGDRCIQQGQQPLTDVVSWQMLYPAKIASTDRCIWYIIIRGPGPCSKLEQYSLVCWVIVHVTVPFVWHCAFILNSLQAAPLRTPVTLGPSPQVWLSATKARPSLMSSYSN